MYFKILKVGYNEFIITKSYLFGLRTRYLCFNRGLCFWYNKKSNYTIFSSEKDAREVFEMIIREEELQVIEKVFTWRLK